MLNIELRHVALAVRARLLGWACTWVLAVSMVHAAETQPIEEAAATSLKHYQSWRDEPPQDWREVNQRVGEIGGWMTYLREAQQSESGMESGMPDHPHHGH